MIVSWTQTHGDDRFIHFQLLQYDVMGIYVRNKCDKNIFSFHNSSKSYVDRCTELLQSMFSSDKLLIMQFNDITYAECVLAISQKIETLGGHSMINIQDDDFFMNTKENDLSRKHIDSVFDFYHRNTHINHFNLFSHVMLPNPDKNINPLETIHSDNGLRVYKWNTDVFLRNKWNELVNPGWPFSWQNGPCILKLSHLNNIMRFAMHHTGNQKEKQDPWVLEQMFGHFYNHFNPVFWGTNQVFFKTINMLGNASKNHKLSLRDNAHRFFGNLESWEEVWNLLEEWKNKESLTPP